MGLDSFSYKINFLKQNLSEAFRLELESQGLSFISQALQGVQVPDYVKNCLLVDMLYACIKHHLWINHKFFAENLQQHMIERYRIERGYCSNLLYNFSRYLNCIVSPPDFEELKNGNESFITYIFVMTLSSTSEANMLEEIGLGNSIFKKISEAIKSFAIAKQGPDGISVAVTDDDLEFHQVIEKISHERAKTPWFLDSSRIRYLLATAPSPFGEILWKQGVDSLEKLMIQIGQGFITKLADALSYVKNIFADELSLPLTDKEAKLFLDFLKARGLLFYSYYSPSNAEVSVAENLVVMSELGFELTATHFASSCDEEKLIPEYLLSLSGSWQLAVLRRHKSLLTDSSISKQFLALPLAPESIELLMSFLTAELIEKELDFFANQLQRGLSPVRRLAFCQAISQVQDPKLVIKLLLPVAKYDRSDKVRNMALVQLLRIEGFPNEGCEELRLHNARHDLGAVSQAE